MTQRVFGLCLGYEDVSDHDAVGKDPLLAAGCGKREGDLAGHATLSRLELTRPGATAATRYEKIEMLQERVDDLLADFFVEAHNGRDPGLIVLDVDNSDVPASRRAWTLSYCYPWNQRRVIRTVAPGEPERAGARSTAEGSCGRTSRRGPAVLDRAVVLTLMRT